MTVAGAVLAGGHSRRMGRPKALIPVEGRAMADRVLDALGAGGVAPAAVIGGGHESLTAPSIVDAFPGEGPVGGIITALRHFDTADRVVVVACDLPFLNADAVMSLLAADATDTVVVAHTGERREPLCAVWPVPMLGDLEEVFAQGERAVHRVLDRVPCTLVPVDVTALVNVNTARDLEVAVGSSLVPIQEISVADLQALGTDICLIDVREADEWAESHVPYAVHVPLGTVPDRLDAFSGSPTYVICKVGGRSMGACDYAAAHGHEVVNVTGGMLAWLDAGFEIA